MGATHTRWAVPALLTSTRSTRRWASGRSGRGKGSSSTRMMRPVTGAGHASDATSTTEPATELKKAPNEPSSRVNGYTGGAADSGSKRIRMGRALWPD